MIKLSRLVLEDLKLNTYEKSIEISGLSSDSRSIKKGYLFAPYQMIQTYILKMPLIKVL